MIWQILFFACFALPFVLFLAADFVRRFEVGKMVALVTVSLLVSAAFGWIHLLFWLGKKVFGG